MGWKEKIKKLKKELDEEEEEEAEEEEEEEEKIIFREKVNERGFQIEDKERGITLKSSGYFLSEIEPSTSTKIKFFLILSSIVGSLLAFFVFFIGYRFDVWWAWILILLAMAGGVSKLWKWVELFFLYGSKTEFKENHGLSHKVIALIEEGLEPTLENLQKMPRIFKNCKIGDSTAQRFIITKEPKGIKLYAGLEVTKQYYRKVQS